jgi:hypothetical protein
MAVRKARALERRGPLAAAVKQFELVARKAGPGHPSAATAQERVRQLKAWVPGLRTEPVTPSDRSHD